MKRGYDRLIFCIIALFILLSGICLEQPSADSLFACSDSVSSASYIDTLGKAMRDYELSATEVFGARSSTFVSAGVRRPVIRLLYRLSFILFLADILLLKMSNPRDEVETRRAPETHYFTALLHYILKQDGKK